ncbi:MAG: hypothetical protein M3362_17470 [Acidobacteriota bacterium]|nr:hypothetical protein [Acidobacteriota bacterium]
MSGSYDYEAKKRLADERDHGEHPKAIEMLKEVIFLCEGSDSVTRQYLLRKALIALYGVYKAQGQSEEASQYHRKAIKLGITKEELEKA